MAIGVTGILIIFAFVLLFLIIAYLIGVINGSRSTRLQEQIKEDIAVRRYK